MALTQLVIMKSFVKFYQFLIYGINFRLAMDIVCIHIILFTAQVVHMFFFFIDHNPSYSGKKKRSLNFFNNIIHFEKNAISVKIINPDLPGNQNDIYDNAATTNNTGGKEQDLQI